MTRLRIHVRGQAARRLGMHSVVFAHMQESFVNNASIVGWHAVSKYACTNPTRNVPRTIFCIYDERPLFLSSVPVSGVPLPRFLSKILRIVPLKVIQLQWRRKPRARKQPKLRFLDPQQGEPGLRCSIKHKIVELNTAVHMLAHSSPYTLVLIARSIISQRFCWKG